MGAEVDTLVWTKMVLNIAHEDIRHVGYRAPFLGTIVSGARVPVIRSIDVDLPSDVAESQPAPRHDRYGIMDVGDAIEVPVQL